MKPKSFVLWLKGPISQMHDGLGWRPYIRATQVVEYNHPKDFLETYMRECKSNWTKREYKILPEGQKPKATKNCPVVDYD